MHFTGCAVSDIGISKNTNQDSACIKIAKSGNRQIAMAVVCDGMGGLKKGELASATVIRAFLNWFDSFLPNLSGKISWNILADEWSRIIKEQNYYISQYGNRNGITLGTTVSALLIIDNKYLIAHVGDSRVYNIKNSVIQLTEDQTFVAREIERGTMTLTEAATDPRRNMLLQCCGASTNVQPQIIQGKAIKDSIYMLCSDGFRHVISNEEIFNAFNPANASDYKAMENNSNYLINTVKNRNEQDNITVLLLKCFD